MVVLAGEDGDWAVAAVEVSVEIHAANNVFIIEPAWQSCKIMLVSMKSQLLPEKSASSVMAREIRDKKTPAAPKTVTMQIASPISDVIRLQGSLACLRHAQAILIDLQRPAIQKSYHYENS